MTRLLRTARRAAGLVRRRLVEAPELSAWRHACRVAGTVPRFTPGRIRMMEYDLAYSDLLSFCPQWHDIFVARSLAFVPLVTSPRILDCGANVGLATLFFKRLAPSARITAFEADPAIAALLSANLERNGAADVDVASAAIWTEAGQVTFRAEGADSGAIEQCASGLGGQSVTVRSVRLADLLQEPVDVLKLDIEGAEAAVLEDAAGRLVNVAALLLDVHEFDPARRAMPRILDILTSAGLTYAVCNVTPLPWRPPIAPPQAPFAGQAMCWTTLVRAWRTH